MSSKKIDTKSKILQAAWTLLEKTDGSDVRMADIAKAAGISRQAVYLHFPSRTELLIAVTRYIDEVKDVDALLAESRDAPTGTQRLPAYIRAWGTYLPQIYPLFSALQDMRKQDPDAAAAADNRMQAVRHGCQAAIDALERDGELNPAYSNRQATDILWMLLSVPTWERLRLECGWSQEDYIQHIQDMAARLLLRTP